MSFDQTQGSKQARSCATCKHLHAPISECRRWGCNTRTHLAWEPAAAPESESSWREEGLPPPVGHNGGPPLDEGLSLPDADEARGDFPMFDGLLAYFPNALAEVSRVSKIGNDQHNPGQPMHWARDKSTDHGNKIVRHLVDAGKRDGRGVRHTARAAWRILAMLQEEIERDEGLPPSRASRNRPF